MIKNILILTYILIVLGVSGFAKASSIEVDGVSYDPRLLKLSIAGKISDRCDHKLAAKVVATESKHNDLSVVIEVVNKNPIKSCGLVSNSESQFDMILDIRSLNLPAGTDFNLKFANKTSTDVEEIQVSLPKTSIDHSANVTSTKGQLVLLGTGEFALLKADKTFIMVKSTIDLSKYVGAVVNISGIEFVHQVGPIIEVNSLDPLSATHGNNNPAMFVLSISTLPLE